MANKRINIIKYVSWHKRIILFATVVLLLFANAGIVFSAIKIPKQLRELGFTEEYLLNYRREELVEFYEFSDWRTQEKGDTIVFIVRNGKIREWYKFKEGYLKNTEQASSSDTKDN
jgi:hypothetical protein